MSGLSRPTDISGLAPAGEDAAPDYDRDEIAPSSLNRPLGTASTGQASGAGSRSLDTDRLAQLFWKAKHPTITYCSVFWAFGMCVAFLGPTQRDLGCKTGSNTKTMSWIFFAQALFILIGSATAGFVIERFSVNHVMFFSTMMMSLTLALIPLCKLIGFLALLMAIMGYFMGMIDSICNLSMLELYGKLVSPFLQMLHFFYGLGAFVSPMVAEPFLLNENCNLFLNGTSDDEPMIENTTLPAKTLEEAQELTRVDFAFWIMSLLQIPVIALVTSLAFKHMLFGSKSHADDIGAMNKSKEEYENVEIGATKAMTNSLVSPMVDDHPPATQLQIYSVTILSALLLFLYDGMQATYGGYIYSYAVENFKSMSSSEAAYLNAYFWGTFALGRLFSIIIATKLSPAIMLLCNISGCTLAMVIMMVWYTSRTALYIGTCIFGAFLSSIYPTAISLAEQLFRVTTGLTSFIVVGAAAGEMLFPVIIGHQFDLDPMFFLKMGLDITLMSFVVFFVIWLIGSRIRQTQDEPGFIGAVMSLMPIRIRMAEGASEETGLVNRHVKYYSRMRNTSESNDGDADQEVNNGEAIEINHDDYRKQ